MRMRISLETQAPLAISLEKATGNELRTATRVPGATWRGALAAHVIEEWGLGDQADQDEQFKRLFLSGQVRFGDLRPEGRRPWPLSARGCARDDRHPVLDVLVATALGGELPLGCRESGCRAKVAVPREGYYQRNKFGHPMPAGPKRRITAHTAISGRSLRVREEQFFSTEVLERYQRFEGELACPAEAEETVRAVIGERLRLTVGRGGTRGQGDAVLTFSEARSQTGATGVKQRLEELNAFFRESGRLAFTCTLLSPCVVLDEWLLSRSWIAAQDIAEAAGEPQALDGYDVKAGYSRMMLLSGWNAQAQLPKSDIWAIAPGSAFLLARPLSGDRDKEIEHLARVLEKAEDGIGERWEEGLGEAVFCDKFHVQQRTQ